MNFNDQVSGGTKSPKIQLIGNTDNILQTLILPGEGLRAIEEDFIPEQETYENLSNKIFVKSKGYRYIVTLKYDYLNLYGYKLITIIYNHHQKGGIIRFYPHHDRDDIQYDCILSNQFNFHYSGGKMIGYTGNIILESINLIDHIPCDSDIWYFTSVDGEYTPDEISHFTSSQENEYLPGEMSYFTGCPKLASSV
jgi:hypothetical protein